MTDPLFWLGLSLLLVAFSLTTVLIVTLPAMLALARAARSVEKLADTLARELPPTLEAIRLTGIEISELTDDVNDGVQSAGEIVKQVDQSLGNVRQQTRQVQTTTQSIFTGMKVAWKTLTRKPQAKEKTKRTSEYPTSSSHSQKNTTRTAHPHGDIAQTHLGEDSNVASDSPIQENFYAKKARSDTIR